MRGGFLTIVLAACLVAGCGGDMEQAAAPAPKKEAKPVAPPAKKKPGRSTFVKVRKTDYGRILTDGKGRALYLFDKEKTNRSECYGACARAWPVFYARGEPKAGKGLSQKLLGTTRRADGRQMVTYNGHPLYYYVTDTQPGQVTCQNVVEYGGKWLVVAPSGKAIL
jgi:predicted lipoprotein with Yx(FWY)xxD motif